MILKRPPFWAAFPFFDFPPCGQRLFCAPPGRFGFAALRLASLLRAPLGRFQCAAFGGIDCRVTPRRAVLDLLRCARRGFHGNCRFPSGKNHERVPPRATDSFSADEKEPKVRLRGLHRPLMYPLEYLAITRRLPSHPTGTLAVGTTQVAGAPND